MLVGFNAISSVHAQQNLLQFLVTLFNQFTSFWINCSTRAVDGSVTSSIACFCLCGSFHAFTKHNFQFTSKNLPTMLTLLHCYVMFFMHLLTSEYWHSERNNVFRKNRTGMFTVTSATSNRDRSMCSSVSDTFVI